MQDVPGRDGDDLNYDDVADPFDYDVSAMELGATTEG